MNQFVEECRREWKRLRVPDPIATEMAADLAADLEEADGEGATPDDVLGSGASDPRSFAASWAAERGVIPPRSTGRLPRRSVTLAVTAALTIITAVGAALVIFASPDASAPTAAISLPPPPAALTKMSFGKDGRVHAAVARLEAERAHTQALLGSQPNAATVLTLRPAHGQGVEIHRVGSILLIAGIAGAILLLPFLFWSPSRRFDSARL